MSRCYASSINVALVADLDHQDAQHRVLDVADEAIVAHAVAPELAELRPGQRLAQSAGIVLDGEAIPKEVGESPGFVPVELAELFRGRRCQPNPPSQGLAPLPLARTPAHRPCGRAPSSRPPGRSPRGPPVRWLSTRAGSTPWCGRSGLPDGRDVFDRGVESDGSGHR